MSTPSKSKGKPAMSFEAAASGVETAQKNYERLFGATKEIGRAHV